MEHMKFQDKCDIAASFQKTVVLFIKKQLIKALNMTKHKPKSIVVSGGVAANTTLRSALLETSSQFAMNFYAPPLTLCTDNAAMIAWAAIERISAGCPFSEG